MDGQISFTFEQRQPIKGYPELHWTGKRAYETEQFYPAQLKEVYGNPKDGWMNKIFWGDNLQVMGHLLQNFMGKINLVYIDPPFASSADYVKKIKLKKKAVTGDASMFEEKQYTDIWNNDEYLQFIFERLTIIRELLSEQGTIFMHCDWRVSGYVRLIMDEVFGKENFLNEIIWNYSGGRIGHNFFGRKHDTIFWYAKQYGQQTFNYNDVRQEYAESTLKRNQYKNNGSDDRVLDYKPNEDGKFPEDVWNISIINPFAKERLDYPTQKPEKLLEQVIKAASNPGDIVFDCFMGSGTTQAVAMKLGRRFIGADINLGAIQTTTKRLITASKDLDDTKYTGFEVYNVNNYDFFRNPVEAKELIIDALGIQKFDSSTVYDGELDGWMVKIMPTNRIATKADLEELKANLPYHTFEKRKEENPNGVVEKIKIICMGHEADLKASLEQELSSYNLEIEIVDILRDKKDLQFKREADANVVKENNQIIIKEFYPMNLLQKLSMQKESVEDWRQLVESIYIDWNYDGQTMRPTICDIPAKDELVSGIYEIPDSAGKIKIKITDLLSESLELEV